MLQKIYFDGMIHQDFSDRFLNFLATDVIGCIFWQLNKQVFITSLTSVDHGDNALTLQFLKKIFNTSDVNFSLLLFPEFPSDKKLFSRDFFKDYIK